MIPIRHIVHTFLSALDGYFADTYTQLIVHAAWKLLAGLWPYVVAGIILATLLSVLLPRHRLTRFFERQGASSILLASLGGTLTPLDGFGAIPLSAGLMAAGIPPPPVIAFLVSSPLINPGLFFLTAGSLGYDMAILRVICSLCLGVAAGYIAQLLVSMKWVQSSQLTIRSDNECAAIWADPGIETDGLARQFCRKFFSLVRFTGRYFLLSIIIASLVSILIPSPWVAGLLGSHRPFSVFIAAAAGIPLSTCSGASIPIVQELHALGMSKGAVMAFFIAGPAAKLSTLIMLKATFRTSLVLLYVTVALAGALVIGSVCNLF